MRSSAACPIVTASSKLPPSDAGPESSCSASEASMPSCQPQKMFESARRFCSTDAAGGRPSSTATLL
eukprot:155397-Prymnesium_polylepis.1